VKSLWRDVGNRKGFRSAREAVDCREAVLNLAGDGRGMTRSMWMCRKRVRGRGKSPKGVIMWRETLERCQGWQSRAQVRQSFRMAGHTKRWEKSLAIAFIPG